MSRNINLFLQKNYAGRERELRAHASRSVAYTSHANSSRQAELDAWQAEFDKVCEKTASLRLQAERKNESEVQVSNSDVRTPGNESLSEATSSNYTALRTIGHHAAPERKRMSTSGRISKFFRTKHFMQSPKPCVH